MNGLVISQGAPFWFWNAPIGKDYVAEDISEEDEDGEDA